jgi:ABC-type Zn uptake system ZnuABC Zn-binding protein ZnuA
VADFARNIGDYQVTVTGPAQPDTDPRDYEPSPAGVRAIRSANVLIENGARLRTSPDRCSP